MRHCTLRIPETNSPQYLILRGELLLHLESITSRLSQTPRISDQVLHQIWFGVDLIVFDAHFFLSASLYTLYLLIEVTKQKQRQNKIYTNYLTFSISLYSSLSLSFSLTPDSYSLTTVVIFFSTWASIHQNSLALDY